MTTQVAMSLETAVRAVIALCEGGDLVQARDLCDQILRGNPRHAPAAIVALWIAGKAGDDASLSDALRRLAETEGVWSRVPRLPSGEGPPLLLDDRLRTLFKDRTPPVSDISDHLGTLFFETVAASPKLIVELGTRGGESTRALLAAAWRTGARMLSIDIDPCEIPDLPPEVRRLWTFVQSDDVAYGQGAFATWCAEHGLKPRIDVLFIDTSHLYAHTKAELATWVPKLAGRGTLLFHDTHMAHAYQRKDGSVAGGWDNQRGVIRAIEEMLGTTLDETRYLTGIFGDWLLLHDPKSSGFTILRRLSPD
jgi:predicted O-methyltransferase YrrM